MLLHWRWVLVLEFRLCQACRDAVFSSGLHLCWTYYLIRAWFIYSVRSVDQSGSLDTDGINNSVLWLNQHGNSMLVVSLSFKKAAGFQLRQDAKARNGTEILWIFTCEEKYSSTTLEYQKCNNRIMHWKVLRPYGIQYIYQSKTGNFKINRRRIRLAISKH